MIALAFALSLATAVVPDDTDLPRSLSLDESRFAAAEPAAAPDDLALWAGLHLGIAGAYDADHPAFVFGGNFRAHILPWLGAEATIDFQTDQEVEDSAEISQIPFMFAGLFYPPLELPVRPYGIFGFGWTITDVSAPGHDKTDANLLFFMGFGAEFELASNLMLDANVRFVFAQDPPHSGDFSADWAQFTVGILLKLSQ